MPLEKLFSESSIKIEIQKKKIILLPVNEEGLQRGHQKGNLMVVVLEAVEEVEVEAEGVVESLEAAAETETEAVAETENCDDC